MLKNKRISLYKIKYEIKKIIKEMSINKSPED